MTNLDIVSLECWKCSPTCQIDNPVVHRYRKIANCSSRNISLEFVWPITFKYPIMIWKT